MRRIAVIAALLTASCLTGPVAAQGVMDQKIISSTQPLTADQRKRVAEYFEERATRMRQADPAAVVALRTEIVKFLRDATMKDACRRECAAEIARNFRPVVAEPGDARLLRATNVFIIARFAPGNDTVAMLLDSADPAAQQDAAIRVAAAAQLAATVRAGQFAGPQAEAIAKRASAMAKAETNWVAAAHDVETIVEALRTKSLPTAQAESVAAVLGASVNDLTTRSLQDGQRDLAQALQRALLAIRNQTSDVAATARTKLFASIGPSLDRLAGMKGKQVPGFESDEMKAVFESVTNTADLLNKVRATAK
jgi:hypothetical protein